MERISPCHAAANFSHRSSLTVGPDRAVAPLGMEHRKSTAISRKLNPAKQEAFIKGYESLMNQLSADETVIFADAAHPTNTVRPVGCWAPKEVPVAVEQSSGRDRLNIHGAIDLETGRTIMQDVLPVNALRVARLDRGIMLLVTIEAMYPGMRLIHVWTMPDTLTRAPTRTSASQC
jgi:hypothetical protein